MAPWIAGLLPQRDGYVEPFCGMASVLFARPKPPGLELINDLNRHIVTWWQVVQDPESRAVLVDRLMWTPWAAESLEAALAAWDSDDPVDVAWAVAVRAAQQIGFGGGSGGGWRQPWSASSGRRGGSVAARHILAVRDRIDGVAITCRDAAEVIERTVCDAGHAVYVDPPYLGADTAMYAFATVVDDFAGLLVDKPAAIALSGPGHALLDDDGWERHDYPHTITAQAGVNRAVTETLWLNRAAQAGNREGTLWG